MWYRLLIHYSTEEIFHSARKFFFLCVYIFYLISNLSNQFAYSIAVFIPTLSATLQLCLILRYSELILLYFSINHPQYPFWAAKVALCTGPQEGPPLTAFLGLLRDKYSGGLTALFQVCTD